MNEKIYNKAVLDLMINSNYDYTLIDEYFKSTDPIKPKRFIKAHSFIKKDFFSGGLARFLPSSGSTLINFDFASLYPTR